MSIRRKLNQSWKEIKGLDAFAGGAVLFVLTDFVVIAWMWNEDRLPDLSGFLASFGIAFVVMAVWLIVVGMIKSGKD